MKNSEKTSFPKLENELLENILRQLINQKIVIQMFFTRHYHSIFSNLIIHIEKNSDKQGLQKSRWVRKIRNQFKIDIYFIESAELYYKFSNGHPFIEFCCQPSSLIYQNEESGDLNIIDRNWKKYKRKFNIFQDRFYHNHDILKTQIQNLILEGSSNSVYTSYERLIAYDFEYLEELYTGNKSALSSLDERIINLIPYIPVIQKYFVKNSSNRYYFTDLFSKTKAAIANNDEIYKEEMFEAVATTEQGLQRLIAERFQELKKLFKKELFKIDPVLSQIQHQPKDKDIVLEIALDIILKLAEVEQIYLFHKIIYADKTTYYLLLITLGVGNEKLKSITQALKSKMDTKCDFVLLSHDRYWIQTKLYLHQSFFSSIIKGKFPIYSSNPYHPEIHWEVPHSPFHADLNFLYKSTKQSAMQFMEAATDTKENYFGLDSLFTLFFLSFCNTYIFVKTYYRPNYLSSKTLWAMCIYADQDLLKYNYLLEQFWTDFFPYVDKHMTVYHKLSTFDRHKSVQMSVIVEKLINELHNLVIEGGLLFDLEPDLITE